MTERIIDLTRIIEPTGSEAERKFVVHIHNALHEIPGKARPEGEWYIMSDVELMNHANVNHLLLFRAGIPLIENLTNLDQLSRSRVKVFALPIPVKGLDAFPLRVIAVESDV